MKIHSDQDFLQQVKTIIEEELDNTQLNGAMIAERLSISRAHLYRKIKELANVSVAIYVRHYRLARAKKMLQQENIAIQDIAFMTGFSNPNYFSYVFTTAFGQSPRQYRKRFEEDK